RTDLAAAELGRAAGKSRDAKAARRMLAMVLEGMDRRTAAATCGMDRQTLRDWVHRYNAEGLAGLTNLPGGGNRGGSRLRRRPSPGWRLAPAPAVDGWFAGVGRISGGGSGSGSASTCTSGRWASIWRRSAAGGSARG